MKWAKVLLVLAAIVSAILGASDPTDSHEEKLESLKATVDKLLEIVEKQNQEIRKLNYSNKKLASSIKVLRSSVQVNNDQELQEWKGKVVTLENKVTQQDSLLALIKTPYPKNCEEIRLNDVSKESGVYWIDPDGHGVGDPAIQVTCDMSTGTTFVTHDRQNLTDVGHCMAPGCFSQDIKYHVTQRQIAVLMEQSSHCQQLIEYQCFNAPLAFNGIQYSWWEDRHGHKHYFWSGSEDSGHKCHCHNRNECYDPSLTCNCDSMAALQLNDTGLISNKTLLPITRVHFGRTLSPMSSGQYRLGQLECRGLAHLKRVPESCDDLGKIGHSLSGFYSVQKSGKMATVYCDMTKLPGDSDLERLIGITDHVYFYVKSSYSAGSITFNEQVVNVGQAMNAKSGEFVAPTAGIYHFSFACRSNDATVLLTRNGNSVWRQHGPNDYNENYGVISVPAILDLDAGDRIHLDLDSGSIEYYHFVGMLLQARNAS